MKIAIEGCAHGELERIYETIEGIEKERNMKIDLLLCCGDFQSTRNVTDLQTMAVPRKYLDMCTFYKYYSGELVAPILTIFIGGNHEASNYLQELPYGGWVAPNIYYMGYASVVNVNGIRIAGISGIYKGHDFLRGHHEFPPYTEKTCRSVYHVRQLEVFRLRQLSGKVDIFMSHDWPRGIQEFGNKAQLLRFKPHFTEDIENNKLGSRPLEELLKAVQPTYWFAAHLHCKFAALVPHGRSKNGSPVEDDASSSDSEQDEDDGQEQDSSFKSAQEAGSCLKTEPEPGNLKTASEAAAPMAVTKFLALDKCLPKRRFLQVLDIPSTESANGKLNLEYDAEWLSILLTTNHLISVKDHNYFLPGKKAGNTEERSNFTPTDEELLHIHNKFDTLQIPDNFCRTVPAFDAAVEQNYKQLHVGQPIAQLNPQCNEFCSILGIDDPLCLAMLSLGNELPQTASLLDSSLNESSSLTTPSKRKLNMSLPAPTTVAALDKNVAEVNTNVAEVDKNDMELPVEESEQLRSPAVDTDDSKVEASAEKVSISPNLKKLKRRNQSIYQAEENDD